MSQRPVPPTASKTTADGSGTDRIMAGMLKRLGAGTAPIPTLLMNTGLLGCGCAAGHSRRVRVIIPSPRLNPNVHRGVAPVYKQIRVPLSSFGVHERAGALLIVTAGRAVAEQERGEQGQVVGVGPECRKRR